MTKTRSLTPERAGKGDFSPQHSLHAFGLMTRFPVWCRLGSGHSVSQSFCVARAPTTAPPPRPRWFGGSTSVGFARALRERTYDRIQPLSRIVIPLTRAPDASPTRVRCSDARCRGSQDLARVHRPRDAPARALNRPHKPIYRTRDSQVYESLYDFLVYARLLCKSVGS